MRLDAYYYGFDSTGNDSIDLILSAVASAGKAFHLTEDWTNMAKPERYNDRLRGETMVEGIQNAANDAAKLLADRDAEIERLREQHRLVHLDWAAESVKTLELEAEVRELRRDKARLDWLQKEKPTITRAAPSLRAAIDAAMGGEGGA